MDLLNLEGKKEGALKTFNPTGRISFLFARLSFRKTVSPLTNQLLPNIFWDIKKRISLRGLVIGFSLIHVVLLKSDAELGMGISAPSRGK